MDKKFCCGKCRFMVDGMCRRFPPTPILDPIGYSYISVFPPVSADFDVCGEFQRKKKDGQKN